MNFKPPSRPAANATRKALDAYHSELRRYAQQLVEFEQDLNQREALVSELEEELSECECTPDDAMEGCDCVPCGAWREQQGWDVTMDDILNDALFRVDRKLKSQPKNTGDEIEFLDNLFALKDKRKK